MYKDQQASGTERRHIPLSLALSIASAGSVLMIVIRIQLTGTFRYVSLVWNLFLAWIPYVLALQIKRLSSSRIVTTNRKLSMLAIGVVWLFFYPNAPYILTDFIHIIEDTHTSVFPRSLITTNAVLWYDIILNSAFSFIGHFIGLISLVLLHRLIDAAYKKYVGWTVALVAMLLGGYGIYLGRFERLNSWDVFKHPLSTARIVFVNLFNAKAMLFAGCFGFFIFLTYLIVYSFYETARTR